MKHFKVKVTHEVDEGFCEDVMITMVESGPHAVWYWIKEMVSIDRGENLNVKRIEFKVDPDDLPATAKGRDTYVIDHEAVVIGMQRLLSGETSVAESIRAMISRAVADNDADIDSDGADCIAQAFVFNELVYG